MTITTITQLKSILQIEMGGGKMLNNWKLFFMTNRFSLIWLLRYTEYYSSRRDVIGRIMFRVFLKRYTRVQLLTGVTIPLGVFDEGLTVYHTGSIVVNGKTKIGRNCCIMNNVSNA